MRVCTCALVRLRVDSVFPFLLSRTREFFFPRRNRFAQSAGDFFIKIANFWSKIAKTKRNLKLEVQNANMFDEI